MEFLEAELLLNEKPAVRRKKSSPQAQSLNIFEYDNYRKFLKDFYEEKKNLKKGFSYRTFAARAGLGSPSHFQMIVKGDRNLSHKTIPKFTKALGLSARESKFFEQMVFANQAEDPEMKSQYFEEFLKLKDKSSLHKLERERFSFLSRWYIVAIYSLVEVRGFKSDPEWITKKLRTRVTRAQVEEALQTLEALGMIKKDPIKGFVQAVGTWNTDDDTQSVAVYNYHKQMIALALHALKVERLGNREMNGATITIPRAKLNVLKEKIRKFRAEILELASTFENTEEVYQLNVQLFPLSREIL